MSRKWMLHYCAPADAGLLIWLGTQGKDSIEPADENLQAAVLACRRNPVGCTGFKYNSPK